MDGSGKRLHVAGDPPYGATLSIDLSDRANSATSPSASPALGAEALAAHFASRHWALRSNLARPFIHLLCLHAGSAVALCDDSKVLALTGPQLAWLPAGGV